MVFLGIVKKCLARKSNDDSEQSDTNNKGEDVVVTSLSPTPPSRFEPWMMIAQTRGRKLQGANRRHVETFKNPMQPNNGVNKASKDPLMKDNHDSSVGSRFAAL